MIFFSDAHICQ